MPDQPAEIHAFPLAVMSRAYSAEQTTALIARARAVAPDPSIFDDETPFFFGAEVSNASLDSYFTHQLPSSLKNYAADAEEGRSFQNSHNWRELGMGRTLTGRYHDGRGGKMKATEVDIYTLPGLRLNSLSTDDFIRGIRSGIAHDVSIGFHSGAFLCDLCGRDMLTDWDCWHVPGLYYKAKDDEERAAWQGRIAEMMELAAQTAWLRKKSEKEELILCTAGVDNARLSEVSSVYDGACPGAAVQKAMREATEGRLRDVRQVELLQNRYRIALPAPRVQVQGADLKGVPGAAVNQDRSSGGDTDEARRAQILADALQAHGIEMTMEQVRAALKAADDTLAEVNGLRTRIQVMESEIAENAALAKDGEKLRTDLIERALFQGVRAHGNAFDKERMKKRLEGSSVEDIEGDLAMWQEAAKGIFAGGRVTQDTPNVKDGKDVPTTLNAAYRL